MCRPRFWLWKRCVLFLAPFEDEEKETECVKEMSVGGYVCTTMLRGLDKGQEAEKGKEPRSTTKNGKGRYEDDDKRGARRGRGVEQRGKAPTSRLFVA